MIVDQCGEEPAEAPNPQKLFASVVLHSDGLPLDRIEEEYGLYVDSVPYLAKNTVAQDLRLLARLVERESMGDQEKPRLPRFLELSLVF